MDDAKSRNLHAKVKIKGEPGLLFYTIIPGIKKTRNNHTDISFEKSKLFEGFDRQCAPLLTSELKNKKDFETNLIENREGEIKNINK